MNLEVEALVSRVLPWLGGLAGLAMLGFFGNLYHNWYVRRKLREIEKNTRRTPRARRALSQRRNPWR